MSATTTRMTAPSHSNLPFYCPTPEQIRAACLEIQQEWSPEERASRRMGHGGFAMLQIEFLPGSDHPVREGWPSNPRQAG